MPVPSEPGPDLITRADYNALVTLANQLEADLSALQAAVTALVKVTGTTQLVVSATIPDPASYPVGALLIVA